MKYTLSSKISKNQISKIDWAGKISLNKKLKKIILI